MKKIDAFLRRELRKTFRHAQVGFVIDDIQPYDSALASVRMRCYDMIEEFERQGIKAELYRPLKKYKFVIFTKTISESAVKLSGRLKKKGVIVIDDTYYEALLAPENKNDEKRWRVLQIVKNADEVCTCSPQQQQDFSSFHDDVHLISESVHGSFFKVEKQHEKKESVTLVYCGYSKKAKDTLCIEEVMKRLQEKYSCRLLYICESDPKLEGLDYQFVKYDQRRIPTQLLEGDIMIAPRPMEGIEKLAHSFTKVAYPLAVGIPAVASPVPSYVGTPVMLCHNDEEWYNTLEKLILDEKLRQEKGQEGRKYVRAFYSVPYIADKYIQIMKKYM
ncbi:MAG: glycosyltransferase family 4 protein [Lachnospiraceae bacterium]|nr:glycosyltransferase family 4 protein [Lachnospiraceae bacterium]